MNDPEFGGARHLSVSAKIHWWQWLMLGAAVLLMFSTIYITFTGKIVYNKSLRQEKGVEEFITEPISLQPGYHEIRVRISYPRRRQGGLPVLYKISSPQETHWSSRGTISRKKKSSSNSDTSTFDCRLINDYEFVFDMDGLGSNKSIGVTIRKVSMDRRIPLFAGIFLLLLTVGISPGLRKKALERFQH